MNAMIKLYSLDNEVFRYYLYYMALMMLKMAVVVLLTVFRGYQRAVFATTEDAKLNKGKVKYHETDVARVRRIHLNDMENIYVFGIVGLLYIATDPSVFLATTLFTVFAYSRIAHTIVYFFAIPQPSRALSFLVGFLINNYMALSILRFAS